jgi:hypothetical protein
MWLSEQREAGTVRGLWYCLSMKSQNFEYKNNNFQNSEEEYYRGYIKGYRIGRIQATREVLIRILKGERNNDRKLKRKINFETDIGFLDKVIFYILEHRKDTEKIKDFDQIYDTICRSEEEIQNEKHTTYKS